MTTTSDASVVNTISQEDGKKLLTYEEIQTLADSVKYRDLHGLIGKLLDKKGIISAGNFHVMLNVAENQKEKVIEEYFDSIQIVLPNTPEAKQFIKNDESIAIDELKSLCKIATIDTEKQYGYPAVFFNHLYEPVRRIYEKMKNQQVSKNFIYNLPITVIRIIYYMANEDNILKFNTNKKNKYPFVVLEQELRDLLAKIFLKIATSDYFNILAPLYVFSLIPFCIAKDIHPFNVAYPLNKINCVELSSKTFREKAMDLKKIAIEYAKRGHQDIQPVEEEFASDGTTEQSNNSQESQ